ncbi:MAG: metallophosphoesterase [Luteolibacter sp.]|jgi:predicted phosphodiesterase|nr:metallophosphoesterase [Luteolibacter sp.]
MDRRRFLTLSAVAVSSTQTRAQSAESDEKPLLSFGLITDVQYADADPEGERHYRTSIPKLKTAAADLARENLPFTLHLGDVIDRDFKSFAEIMPHFEGLGHPIRHLLGNHDYSVKDDEKSKVPATLEMPADYYAFSAAGVRFVMLDTNEISTYKHPAGSEADRKAEAELQQLTAEGSTHAKPWSGGASGDQLVWLEKELAAADTAKEPVIVCSHHPLLPEDDHRAWNDREILAVIARHTSVRACFCGHYHAGAETISKGIPFITFKSLLHEPDLTAYAVIRLFRKRLVIEGRGREKSREIPLP